MLAGVQANRSRSPIGGDARPTAEKLGSNGHLPNGGASLAHADTATSEETPSSVHTILGGGGSILSELGALLTPKSPPRQSVPPRASSVDDMRELLHGIAQNLAAQQQQINELVERLDAESSEHAC